MYKVVCDSVSVSFACMGLTFFRRAWCPIGIVRRLIKLKLSPGGGDSMYVDVSRRIM